MTENSKVSALVLGVFIFLGLATLGYLLGNAAIKFKEYERTVTVKGLSEREYEADIVIWPIQFTEASNNLGELYGSIERSTEKIRVFLEGYRASVRSQGYKNSGFLLYLLLFRIDNPNSENALPSPHPYLRMHLLL